MMIIESTKCNECISSGGGDCATCDPPGTTAQQGPQTNIPPELAQKIITLSAFKKELIERTKNYGIKLNPDGSKTISCKLSFGGSIENAIRSEGRMPHGAREAVRMYTIGREAWLKGDFETVADLFGVLV
ncbi:MAG: hypothetical protein PHG61_03700 [Candidatus Marinimicrobia bacterium]|nr:hypothetical protein [Candidatus Neomarinimicrobiota bacterium]